MRSGSPPDPHFSPKYLSTPLKWTSALLGFLSLDRCDLGLPRCKHALARLFYPKHLEEAVAHPECDF